MAPSDPRRFPPPWSVEQTEACFIVRDAGTLHRRGLHVDACFIVHGATGYALAYVYFEEERGRRAAAQSLTRETARCIIQPIEAGLW
jgi:hypothetical protein